MNTNWLRKRREQLKISQQDLAARLQLENFDVTSSSISHWENGRYNVPLEDSQFRIALAKALRMTIHDMLAEAGYEIVSPYGEKARRAANIVDQLPENQQDLAIGLLEQLLENAMK